MSSVSVPINTKKHPNMRPMSMFRDLPAVADLIELCFADSMDRDGRRYIADMRRASHDNSFLKWASNMTENASLPLTGFVWEENERIIGNASLIPFRDRGKRIYLIANIAVHPDFRRRGIGRILTQRAMQYGWDKRSSALWLHVRDDNPGAIKLYEDLGFQEVVRRTTWTAKPDSLLPRLENDIQIVPRHSRFWPQQRNWLRRLHPDTLGWYRSFNFNSLQPGFLNWLYRVIMDSHIKQWAAVRDDQLLATLAFTPVSGRSDSLIAATPTPQQGDELHAQALTQLLIHVRRVMSRRTKLSLDYPGGEMTETFISAGYTERRTLLWMRAEPAT
ncbi:MAG: GNAT family N-acetyltransferase [Anaerolineales bacterium]|nr:GNAT family N-acetyltransferase [Anaerolineales bacterium]